MIGQLLKEKTKILHDQVEDKLQSRKIMDKTYTLAQYQNLLMSNYQMISAFENAVFSALSEETIQKLEGDRRRKLPFIQKDLQHFPDFHHNEIKPVQINNEAEALGILYVMEGSTLGGNVIAKNLSKNPNFDGISFHYFGCYGDQTGVLWKNFQQVLEEEATNKNPEDFLNGANTAYQFLLDL